MDPLGVVEEFLKEDEWEYDRREALPLIEVPIVGQHGAWTCFIQVPDGEERVLIYGVLHHQVPAPRFGAMAELIARANWGLPIGNFEFDFSEGQVRFKTSADVSATGWTIELIKLLFYANGAATDRYLPGVEAVMKGEQTPEQAIVAIEGEG